MHTIQTAAHAAWLDPMTGTGYVTVPADDGPLLDLADVQPVVLTNDDGSTTVGWSMESVDLSAADWSDLVSRLDALGWAIDVRHEVVATLPDGREVWLALGPGILADPSIEQFRDSRREFLELTGATV